LDLQPGTAAISEQDLRAFGDVDQVLSDFYTDAVRETAHETRTRESRLRRWIETALITSLDTRGTALWHAAVKAGIPAQALESLVKRHLLRVERRANSEWYEVTHDRLIAPIHASNRTFAARRDRRRFVGALIGLAALALLVIVLVSVLLSGPSSTKVVTKHVLPAGALPPPSILRPVQGHLYHAGDKVRASYVCRGTSAATADRCVGTVPNGASIPTAHVGSQTFMVTASDTAAGVDTAKSVTYSVVAYATSYFSGHAFSFAYPTGWTVSPSERLVAGIYTDTIVRSPVDANTELRVDVTVHPTQTLRDAATSVVRAVESGKRDQPYKLLSFSEQHVGSHLAYRWDFVDSEGGVRLRKQDWFIEDTQRGTQFAVLTQAPVAVYARMQSEFDQLRGTLSFK
jgi:hypothetical protein